jgi:hypothetical protein
MAGLYGAGGGQGKSWMAFPLEFRPKTDAEPQFFAAFYPSETRAGLDREAASPVPA